MNAGDIDLVLIDSDERRVLGMAAQAAFLKMCETDPEWWADMQAVCPGFTKTRMSNDWRHGQVKRITAGRARRISEVVRRDFDELLGAFCVMAGQEERAFRAYLKSGKAAGRAGEEEDTAASVSGWMAKCYKEGPGYGFNAGWMAGYARNVYKKSLSELTASQARSLYITMRSRWLKKQKEESAA